jgi:hypothetical protein
MKFLYRILALLLVVPNVAYAQSIFRGRTITAENFHNAFNIISYEVDNNDNAKLVAEATDGKNFTAKFVLTGVDKSTKKLFDFQFDRNKMEVVEFKVGDWIVNNDGTVTVDGVKKTKSQMIKVGDPRAERGWQSIIQGPALFKERYVSVLPESFFFQICKLTDDEILIPGETSPIYVKYISMKFVK